MQHVAYLKIGRGLAKPWNDHIAKPARLRLGETAKADHQHDPGDGLEHCQPIIVPALLEGYLLNDPG
jgi:hypothetical protein